MLKIEFICSICHTDLKQKNNVYNCNKCSGELIWTLIDT